jgi:uncharacterized YccA/Bax inhibitor family protein
MANRNFLKSSNPMFNEDKLRANAKVDTLDSDMITRESEVMTISGAINKTFILLGVMMITTLFSFAFPSKIFMYVGIFGGIAVVMYANYNPDKSAWLAPIYALVEGLFVGSVSYFYASIAGTTGIIFQAVSLTVALLFMMLFIYKSGLIKVTQKFRAGVSMAVGAIMLVYLLNFVLSFFGMNVPYIHEGGMIGIGISVVIIVVACLRLLLDFDNFEKAAQLKSPKYMEWFCAMGLLVTLVWLYYEILRLLSVLSND